MSFIDWLSGNVPNNKLERSEFLYGPRHLTLWAICIASMIILTIIFRKKSERTKKILFTTLASIFLFFEILQRIFNLIFADTYSVASVFKTLLPLYFCSIAVVFIIIAIFSKKQALIDAATIMGLLVTLAYMIYPAVGLNNKILTFDALYSIGSHGLGLVTSVLLITTGYAKFKTKDIWKTYLAFACVIIYGLIMSLWLFKGEDYLFMLINPLGFDMPVPYTLVYFVILSLYIFSFYIIKYWIIQGKIKREKRKLEKQILL